MSGENELFVLHSVTRANLARLTEEESITAEKRICELAEAASDTADAFLSLQAGGMSPYEILALLSEDLPLPTADVPVGEFFNGKRIATRLKYLSSTDRIFFVDLLDEMLRERGILLEEAHFLPIAEPKSWFAYVKNFLADEAFDVFAEAFDDPRLRYVTTFSEGVRLLKSGEVGYCLLPLEEEGGARISAVEALIYANDLKILSVTPVFGLDGEAKLRYALVADAMNTPSFTKEDDRYFEIRLEKGELLTLGELFSAADAFGISVYRVGTMTAEGAEEAYGYHSIVFKTTGESFRLLLLYLALYAPGFCVTGLYKNAE